MLFFRMRQPLLLLTLALFALIVFVKAGPPFVETNPGTELDTADDTGKAIDADNADEMPSDDGEEVDVNNEWPDADNEKSIDEFGNPISASEDADEDMETTDEPAPTYSPIAIADEDDEKTSNKELADEDNVDWGTEDNEVEPSAEESIESADEDNTEDPFAEESTEEPTEGSKELDDEEDPFAVGTEEYEGTALETEPSDEEDPFALGSESEEATGFSTEDMVEEDPLASDDDVEPDSSASEETGDEDPFAVSDKDDVAKALAADPEENEFGYDEDESSTPTENVAGADDDTESAKEEAETTDPMETSDSEEDAEFPEKYPTNGLDEEEMDNNEEIDTEEVSTADDDNEPEEEIQEDGTVEVEEDNSDNDVIADDQNESSDEADDVETTADDLTGDDFDKAISNDGDDLDEENGDDAAVDIEDADETPENPNTADETLQDPDDPTEASVDDETPEETPEEDNTLSEHGHQGETELDKVQQEDTDVQPAAGHTTHDTIETVQDDMDTDTAYSGVKDDGFDYTQYGSTNGSSHVQYQGAILIAAVGVVGLFVVKRSRETIIQGVQKLSGRQSDQGQYSHLPLSTSDGDTPNHNLSNTTSEWAVDMSNAIDHDHQDESKPSRGMKLSHAKKASQTNSIPLKPVQDRKSQEWADWKEDEEDW